VCVCVCACARAYECKRASLIRRLEVRELVHEPLEEARVPYMSNMLQNGSQHVAKMVRE